MTQRLFVMPCSSDVLAAIGQLEPALGARARAFGFRMPAGRVELGGLLRAPGGAPLLGGGARVAPLARGGRARRGAGAGARGGGGGGARGGGARGGGREGGGRRPRRSEEPAEGAQAPVPPGEQRAQRARGEETLRGAPE